MKCICGYTHYQEWQIQDMNEDKVEFVQGEEPFLRSSNYHVFDNQKLSYHETKIERAIYACPKCGTLKIEI